MRSQHTRATWIGSGLRGQRRLLLTALVPALMVLGVACAGDEAVAPTPTPTPTVTATETPDLPPTDTPTATATGTPSGPGVEELDFTDPDVIGPLIDHFGGGEVPPERVEFVDLTGDGIDEALVIVESGGTMGDLGGAILGVDDGDPVVMYFINVAGLIEVRFGDVGLGIVAAMEPVYADGDPSCCPSELRETIIQWDGDEFVIVSEQVVENPDL